MRKDLDSTHAAYTCDAVMKRGYELYDEWEAKRLSSRRITARAENALSKIKSKKARSARLEALAFLFSLDLRIKKKYGTLLACLLHFFARRRELNAVMRLKAALRISPTKSDLRTAIEIELERLREQLEAGEEDDSEDGTRGGRHNGKAREEAQKGEEKQQEQSAEERTEETAEAEKSEQEAEQAEETPEEKAPTEESEVLAEEAEQAAQADSEEKQATAEISEDASERTQSGIEGKGSQAASESVEQTVEKPKETASLSDPADPAMPPEEKEEESSFIDEIIIDNMIRGKANFITANPFDHIETAKDGGQVENGAPSTESEAASSDEKGFLYDEMPAKLDHLPTDGSGPETDPNTAKTETKPDASAEAQVESDPKANDNPDPLRQSFENLRTPLQVNMNIDPENQMRREINARIIESEEAVAEIHQRLTEALREQMAIDIGEFGMDDRSPITEKAPPPKSPEIRPTSTRK